MDQKPDQQQSAPDALSKEPAAGAEAAQDTSRPAGGEATGADGKPPKKLNPLKKFFRKVNIYLVLFIFVLAVAGAIATVSYLNSKKAPVTPTINSQSLTTDTLKQLANSDATVGNSSQTLTIQGNAVFTGGVLIRSDLNVAGTIKVGGEMIVSTITVSGKANLGDTQVSSLQVANASTLQGSLTLQKDLNVAGTTSFSGPVTAGQITVTKLILSGNAQLQVPNHIAFTGASPGRSINAAALGAGGTASVNGSDTAGNISINSGSSPAAGCMVTINFNQAFTSTPHVLVTPVGAAAGQTAFYVNRSTTSFSICGNNPAPGGQAFGFDYFVTQ